ncbi:MAG: hypothetical protein JOZ69_10050, partial [Myxococcales bacterium]|nr:hypothetical protein [Myxococcales bacterium]
MQRTTAITAAIAGLLGAAAARAEGRPQIAGVAVAPAGGGLPELRVEVDLAAPALVVSGAKLPIPLERAELPAPEQVVTEVLPIGRGRSVVHVRVPATGGPEGGGWEAILAGGRSQPIFAGRTGLLSGDPGERSGKRVQVVPSGEIRFVLVGDVREDVSLCGPELPLLDPMALYPATLELHPATVQRLTEDQQASARAIAASPLPAPAPSGQEASAGAAFEPPLARLLVARGSSVPGSRG